MLDRQMAAGQIALGVLNKETWKWLVYEMQMSSTTALKILDRWALNSPEKLKELEWDGNGAQLHIRLAEQEEKEVQAREEGRYWELIDSGLNHWEALEMMGIKTEL